MPILNIMDSLTEQILAGKKRAIARLITQIENQQPEAQTILSQLYPHTGHAHLIGITGAPGTGKSSLVSQLAQTYRQHEKRVAILAVDPSSPFSGGALLGDRIRMQELTHDPGVYIRSMASRGGAGGLTWAVDDALKVLDAAGFEIILIETVGAGQSEVAIVKTAHTIIVVEAPGLGDDIQAIKAGILEIADIFVVNKADHPQTERTVLALQQMLEMSPPSTESVLHHGKLMVADMPPKKPTEDVMDLPVWEIPVLKTVALHNEGVDAVVETLNQHYRYLSASGDLARRNRRRLDEELQTILQAELMRRLLEQLPPDYLSGTITKLTNKQLTPYQAVQKILQEIT